MTGEDLRFSIVIGLIVLLIITIIFSETVKFIKKHRGRKKALENNIFLKERMKDMDDLLTESRKLADVVRVEFIITLLFLILIEFALIKIIGKSSIVIYIIYNTLAFIILSYISINYQTQFRNTVVGKILAKYKPQYKYFPFEGFSKEEYLAFLEYSGASFASSDMIKIDESLFEFAWIKCSHYSHDYDGGSKTYVDFLGSIGKIEIPNLNCEILLTAKDILSIYPNEKKTLKKIKFEQEDFNKYFVVYADSETDVKRILSESTKKKLIEIREKLAFDIDIRIRGNYLYLKLPAGSGIAPSLWNGYKERKSIYVYLSTLEATFWACTNIKNQLEQK